MRYGSFMINPSPLCLTELPLKRQLHCVFSFAMRFLIGYY
ncbi:hypothetical protein CHCC15290_3253 [Bacillus licheniformis]|nr:hypothetical protein CHCC15546_1451 [Bacillus licheniformis]TWL43793.1 hypothetical protein CHCC15543_1471 [Bacillus licheniformis]TWL89373.1 hypothetical protein CHCC15290_3253 [Bacillus licheniformis]TWM01785.1 hypothetical protein CHCC15289_3165 [Bacillus licheniformis]TWN26480.1 hypothetical protein CHCC14559_2577 [Bacillus licheniformis]